MKLSDIGPWHVGEDGHGIWADVNGVERRIADVSARAVLVKERFSNDLEARVAARELRKQIAQRMAASQQMFDVLWWHFGKEEDCERCRSLGERCLAHSAMAKAEGRK